LAVVIVHLGFTEGESACPTNDGATCLQKPNLRRTYELNLKVGQVEAIHGGAIATLLDNAMGWATNTVLQDDENFATADVVKASVARKWISNAPSCQFTP